MAKGIVSQNLSFTYPILEEPSLKDINFEIGEGECVLICGRSGSGKTSLSRLINGISPDYIEGDLEGSLMIFDLEAGASPIEDFVPVVGSVYQNPKTQHFTVDTTSEMAFPMENMGVPPEKIMDRIQDLAQEFEVSHLLDRNFFELSGGEKQQIAFVTALVLKPRLLVLDEVTANLDLEAIKRLTDMIARLKAAGTTIVMAEHRLSFAKGIVDRYLALGQGHLVHDFSADLFHSVPNEELKHHGLRARDLTAHKEKLELKIAQRPEPAQPSLVLEGLAIGHDKKAPLVEGLDLAFEPGRVTGIMGKNGVGKSTLAEVLTGLRKPLKGQIYWKGQATTEKDRRKLAFLVMQDTNYQLFSDSVEGEVLLGAKYPDRLDEVLDILNIEELRDRHPMSLSGGQKQRVAIASAVLSGKELIILDEPTSGLDGYNMQRFGRLIQDLKALGHTLLIITHDIELAADWCDGVVVLKK